MKSQLRIAVVDDEPMVGKRLKQILSKGGFALETFLLGEEVLARQEENPFHLILTDIRLPDIDGIEVLARIKKDFPSTEVVLITGFATLDQAVEAVKKGAFYYLAKPFTPDQVRAVVGRAIERITLFAENQKLREEVYQKIKFEGIVGISSRINDLLQAIGKVSRIDCNVLIQGESGTGKELVARAIHLNSQKNRYYMPGSQ
jgi:DNA-binding NtrC family response regulator